MALSTNMDDLANSVSKLKMNLDRLSGTVDGWTRSGQGYPDFDFFQAERAEFVYPPWGTAGFRLVSTQIIATDAWDTLVFNHTDWNTGIIDYSTASTGLFRFTRPSDNRVFLIFGHVSWSIEGTTGGPHAVKLVSYPSTQEIVMSQVSAASLSQSFSCFYRAPAATTGFGIQAFANFVPEVSGASLGMWELPRQ